MRTLEVIASEWHLPKIAAPTAWSTTTGASSVTIAICDTGVDATHPDLLPNIVPGWNVYNNNPDTTDVHGHGTQVAVAAAACSNNSIGVASELPTDLYSHLEKAVLM